MAGEVITVIHPLSRDGTTSGAGEKIFDGGTVIPTSHCGEDGKR